MGQTASSTTSDSYTKFLDRIYQDELTVNELEQIRKDALIEAAYLSGYLELLEKVRPTKGQLAMLAKKYYPAEWVGMVAESEHLGETILRSSEPLFDAPSWSLVRCVEIDSQRLETVYGCYLCSIITELTGESCEPKKVSAAFKVYCEINKKMDAMVSIVQRLDPKPCKDALGMWGRDAIY